MKNKIFVQYQPPIHPDQPVFPRKYIVTHSDITGDLFLTVSPKILNKRTPDRDEVFAKWIYKKGYYALICWVDVDGNQPERAQQRYQIFKKEMPKALQTIIYGDRFFLACHFWLYSATIYVHYKSKFKPFRKKYCYGPVKDFNLDNWSPPNRFTVDGSN